MALWAAQKGRGATKTAFFSRKSLSKIRRAILDLREDRYRKVMHYEHLNLSERVPHQVIFSTNC